MANGGLPAGWYDNAVQDTYLPVNFIRGGHDAGLQGLVEHLKLLNQLHHDETYSGDKELWSANNAKDYIPLIKEGIIKINLIPPHLKQALIDQGYMHPDGKFKVPVKPFNPAPTEPPPPTEPVPVKPFTGNVNN